MGSVFGVRRWKREKRRRGANEWTKGRMRMCVFLSPYAPTTRKKRKERIGRGERIKDTKESEQIHNVCFPPFVKSYCWLFVSDKGRAAFFVSVSVSLYLLSAYIFLPFFGHRRKVRLCTHASTDLTYTLLHLHVDLIFTVFTFPAMILDSNKKPREEAKQ